MKNKLNAVAALFLAFSLFAVTIINAQNTDKELYAVILKAEGNVRFQPENTSKWFKAKAGLGLKKGDLIKTNDNSEATVILEGGSIFKISSNSIIKLETIIINLSKKTSEIQVTMPQKSSIISHINKMKSARVSVRTPVATVSIRGTGLSVDVLDENTADIAVFEGKVVVKDFVQESGLPKDGDELMLAFLHEISVKPDQVTTVTKKGIGKPQKIQGSLLVKKEEFKRIKASSDETLKSWSGSTYEQRKAEREKTRNEAIAEGE